MGWLSKVTKGIRSGVKGIQKGVQRIPEETRNFSNSMVRTGTALGAAPFQIAGGVATQGIQAVAPAISAATGVLQDNPMLAGALGSMIGVPGLGGAFSGGGDTGASGGGSYVPAPAEPDAPATPMWIWLAGGGGVLVLALLLFRKKS